MESAWTTDDGSTEVGERKRLPKRERAEDCFAQKEVTVYENKAFVCNNVLCFTLLLARKRLILFRPLLALRKLIPPFETHLNLGGRPRYYEL
jgi:hypothetical protein